MHETSPNVADVGERPEGSSLEHMPAGRWEFDHSVTSVFDDMLDRSIPYIEAMRAVVTETAMCFVQPSTYVVDLGCSLGGAMGPLVKRFGGEAKFIGIEASIPMVDTCRRRFRTFIDSGIVDIRHFDLRHGYPQVDASLTLSILTLMFTPIEHRFRILSSAYDRTSPGGALILVEKILGADARTNGLLEDLYRQHKRRMGYSEESIARKALAIEGVLVPVTARWNEQMLHDAGFDRVDCIWRSLNFAGWVAIK